MTRICITGGPRTGKTTLAMSMCNRNDHIAQQFGTAQLRHTDDLVGKLDWSDASAEVARWLDEPGLWVIEGVAVSRALRKWRDNHPGEPPPVDRVIYLDTPRQALTPGQQSMTKSVRKVHDEIEPWLRQHGITTEHR